MIEIHSGRITIESGTGRREALGPPHQIHDILAGCWVAISGYHAQYDDGDHHLQTLEVGLTCTGKLTDELGGGDFIKAIGSMLLRDDGDDNRFSGWIDYTLFVDLVTLSEVGPHGRGLR